MKTKAVASRRMSPNRVFQTVLVVLFNASGTVRYRTVRVKWCHNKTELADHICCLTQGRGGGG